MRESRRADFEAVGLIRSVTDEVNAKLALGRFDACIDLTCRHFETFSIEFKVMDKRFHALLHITTARRRDFIIFRHNRPFGHHLETLAHDFHALIHFFDTANIAVITITVFAERDFEIEFRVNFIWLATAQIPRHTRTT